MTTTTRLLLSMIFLACACGDDGGSSDADAGAGDDAGGELCGFEDRYLPYQVGYSWSFEVLDLGSGARETKDQRIEAATDRPELGDDIFLQITEKPGGETRSYLRRDGDVIVRLVQEDYDALGTLERTTEYDPGQIRLDESDAHTAAGATWDETYTRREYDAAGTLVETLERSESWEVLSADAECGEDLGGLRCLHVRKVRTAGGIADKQYYYARGVGKVQEVGSNQVENLTGCQ